MKKFSTSAGGTTELVYGYNSDVLRTKAQLTDIKEVERKKGVLPFEIQSQISRDLLVNNK